MGDVTLIITFGGKWEGEVYTGGVTRIEVVPKNLSVNDLVEIVHSHVGADLSRYSYDLRSILLINEKIGIIRLNNDRNMHLFLSRGEGKLLDVYVTLKELQPQSGHNRIIEQPQQFNMSFEQPHCDFNVPIEQPHPVVNVTLEQPLPGLNVSIERLQQPHNHESFVQLMTSQFISGCGSNQMYNPLHSTDPVPCVQRNDYDNFPFQSTFPLARYETNDYTDDEDLQQIPESDEEIDSVHWNEYWNEHLNEYDSVSSDEEMDHDRNDGDTTFGVDEGLPYDNPMVTGNNVNLGIEPITNVENEIGQSSRGKRWTAAGSKNCSIPSIPTEMSSSSNPSIFKGAFFCSKDDLKTALGLLALKERFEYRIKRSSNTRFYVTCKNNPCKFELRAVGSRGDGCSYWTVRKFEKEHNCQLEYNTGCPRQVPTHVISSLLAPRLHENGRVIRPRDVIGEMRSEYGVEIQYSKAWMATARAHQLIHGDPMESFQQLPSYLYMLEVENPGTVTKLKIGEENRFESLFLALGPCINGFRSCCRPVIAIDGTHLKGKYRGVMFVAATKDGNEQIYPIGFGFGSGENDLNWTWFLGELREVIGTPDDLIIISDRHVSIGNAIKEVFPNAAHGLCTWHIKQNLKKFRNEKVNEIFHRASRMYRRSDFDKQMRSLQRIHPRAYDYLLNAGIERWARSYSPVRRYFFMTTNVAEVLNSCLRYARKLPICTVVEYVRDMLQRWFNERRISAERTETRLTEWANGHVMNNVQDGETFQAKQINDFKFRVRDGSKNRVVNLRSRECDYGKFQLDLLPCSHACAAIRKKGLNILDFCGDYYLVDKLREAYSVGIHPVPDADEWDTPREIKEIVINPPVIEKQAGRPKTRRIPSSGERRRSRPQVCSNCKQSGHNRVNCRATTPTDTPHVEGTSSDQQTSRRRRACSICGQPGHTRLKCPMNIN